MRGIPAWSAFNTATSTAGRPRQLDTCPLLCSADQSTAASRSHLRKYPTFTHVGVRDCRSIQGFHRLRPARSRRKANRETASIHGERGPTFLAPSVSVRDDWVNQGLPADRVHVVPQAIDGKTHPPATLPSSGSARKVLGLLPAAFVDLYLGRIVPDQGVEVVVRAWPSMDSHLDEGQLFVVGPSWPQSSMEYLHVLAPSGCRSTDAQSDVVPILHSPDVLVLPALRDEPFGRVTIEAKATRSPAVASRSGGIPEIHPGESFSMVVGQGNEEGLAARLLELQHWRRDEPGSDDAGVTPVAGSFDLVSAADAIEQAMEVARDQGSWAR